MVAFEAGQVIADGEAVALLEDVDDIEPEGIEDGTDWELGGPALELAVEEVLAGDMPCTSFAPQMAGAFTAALSTFFR